jgi:NitT/TauT family transport system substrate-binding protein
MKKGGNNMSLRSTLRTLALIAAGGATMILPATAQQKLIIGYTGANDFLAAFVAKDKGFFEKRGIDVTLTRIANGSTIPAAMIGGSMTIGTITPPILMQANDAGLGLKILSIASIQSSKNPTASVVIGADAKIEKPSDFVGKKVGAPGLNSVMHVMFVRWLKSKNVDDGRVTFVEAAFPQFGDLLKGKQIDAALVVEPFRTRIASSGVGKTYANFFSDVRDNVIFSLYAVTGDWAVKNPKAVQAVREALDEAVAFIRDNPDEAKKSQITYLGLPAEVVASLPLATFQTKIEPPEVQYWIDLTKELGIISKPLAVNDLIVP